MGIFGWYFQTSLLLRIFIALILGVVTGLVVGPGIAWVNPFGVILVRLLQMIVLPVVVFTLVVGAASIHPSSLGRIGVKALTIYLFTSAFAVAFGLLFANLFNPGESLQLVGTSGAAGKQIEAPSLVDTLMNIIPTNPFNAIASGHILSAILVSILFGIGVSYLKVSEDERIRNAANTVYYFFEGGAEVMYKVVRWVLEYAPIGVFALIAVVFGNQGAESLGPLTIVIIAVYLAFICHAIVVYGGLLTINRLSFLNSCFTHGLLSSLHLSHEAVGDHSCLNGSCSEKNGDFSWCLFIYPAFGRNHQHGWRSNLRGRLCCCQNRETI